MWSCVTQGTKKTAECVLAEKTNSKECLNAWLALSSHFQRRTPETYFHIIVVYICNKNFVLSVFFLKLWRSSCFVISVAVNSDCGGVPVFGWFLNAVNNLAQLTVSNYLKWGTRWRSGLRHCATSLKVVGSIPDGVIGIFHWHNPFGRTMALGSSQPLTEMSTTNISWWIKGCRCVRLTTFICRLSLNLGASTSWNPHGLSRPVQRLLYLLLYLPVNSGRYTSSATRTIEWENRTYSNIKVIKAAGYKITLLT
jgi:hypothetical protein